MFTSIQNLYLCYANISTKNCIYGICLLLLFISCGKNSKSGQAYKKDSSKSTVNVSQDSTPPLTYNLFIENSYSMDGYVSAQTQFKKVLIQFISDIPTHLNNAPSRVYFINNATCQQPTTNWTYFIENLNPKNLHQSCPFGGDTQIDRIIDLCTDKLDSNVNIVVSDCIFSKENVTPDVAEADLKMFIARKLNNSKISSVILKYNSDFSGQYYAESIGGKAISLPKANRPFYVLIFGNGNNLQAMLSKINFAYLGFEASYCLIPNKNAKPVEAAITTEDKKGTFSFKKPATSKVIYNAAPNKDDAFQFSINTDLSGIPVEKSFLLNPANYSVNDGFKVVSITPLPDGSNYTHRLTVMTNNLQQKHDLKIGLRYEVPDWVVRTGSMSDNNPADTSQQHQTYGFASLMKGISQAYIAKNGEQQFVIAVSISQNEDTSGNSSQSVFPWWILIAGVIIVGIFIWAKNKSK